jgi:2-dehydropantoate 2-reductase
MLGHWQPQIDTLNRQGITLIHPDKPQTNHPVKATNDPAEIPAADLVLIMVKTINTAAAARHAATILAPGGLALTLQNGLGNLETIAGIVGHERTALGTTSEGATLLEPGLVRHAGTGQTYLARNLPGGAAGDQIRLAQIEQAASLFNRAGFNTHLVDNADSLIWGKLAVNAGINPITALLQVPNGFLNQNPDAGWIMGQAAAEVAAVARALSISLPFPDPVAQARTVVQSTAANYSSMAQDLARGAPTEIEAICGMVVRYGQQQGVSTPVNQTLLNLIQQQTAHGQWQTALEAQPFEIRQRLVNLLERN